MLVGLWLRSYFNETPKCLKSQVDLMSGRSKMDRRWPARHTGRATVQLCGGGGAVLSGTTIPSSSFPSSSRHHVGSQSFLHLDDMTNVLRTPFTRRPWVSSQHLCGALEGTMDEGWRRGCGKERELDGLKQSFK